MIETMMKHPIQLMCNLITLAFMIYITWLLLQAKERLDEKAQQQIETPLEGLFDTLNTKSPYYSNHSKRVSLISNAICDVLDIQGIERNQIIQAAKLHDLGKIFIDEEVLHRDGKLTEIEWYNMKLHPLKGCNMAKKFGISEPVSTMILYHHENMDGTGYPLQIEGENIPMGARIIRVADSIDAMAMKRPYRDALAFQDIDSELVNGMNKLYDETIIKKVTNGLARRIRLIILNNS